MVDKMSKLRWHGRGVFPSYPQESVERSGDENGDACTTKPDLGKRQLKTFIANGPKVTVADFAMRWKNHKEEDSPSTTHELTFDTKNGFDQDHVYVSGMTVNMIARVNKKDPTKQDLFRFPSIGGRNAMPHTLKFASMKSDALKGILFVGLEEQGLIVKLDMKEIMIKYKSEIDEATKPVDLCKESDYKTIYDVRISGDTIPFPINTRPHGFCFDACHKNIWFTGKLTNTIGRIGIDGSIKSLQHFELPTLGAVPIYVALGPDNNVWGTCLKSSIIFRVTTGENPVVDEISISDVAKDRKPIAIKPDPKGRPFMWFSTEAGHSICRLDTKKFQAEVVKLTEKDKTGKCVCSPGCRYLFKGSSFVRKIITEFPVPKINRRMKLAGFAITKDGAIWTQSYVEPTQNTIEKLPDYILKLGFDTHFPTSTYDPNRSSVVNMTGVPIHYFELPTKDTVLHRIMIAPDEEESVWFTELQSDRLGTITFEERNFGTATTSDSCEEEPTSKKRART
jgi:virginiamycin B lyase